MLEPLFRCNLACAGCGKIQYPAHVLKKHLTPEECFRAVDECGAPMVSIPGGEPLMHPQIDEIVKGLVARKKYIYLCTNALLLKEKLARIHSPANISPFPCTWTASANITISPSAAKAHTTKPKRQSSWPLARGFRVTTNTTLFDGADPQKRPRISSTT